MEPLRHTDVGRVYWEAGGGTGRSTCPGLPRITAGLQPTRPLLPEGHRSGVGPDLENLSPKRGGSPACGRRAGSGHGNRAACLLPHRRVRLPAASRPYSGQLLPEASGTGLPGSGGQAPAPNFLRLPETRRYVISLFREMAQYPIDGVGVLYNRRPPLVAYEEPLVRGFQSRYGQDPRRLDELDPRWLAFRSQALTRFMRELRQELDDAAQHTNRSTTGHLGGGVPSRGKPAARDGPEDLDRRRSGGYHHPPIPPPFGSTATSPPGTSRGRRHLRLRWFGGPNAGWRST